jgi:L-threonylcarbamoyladenylate synthase
MLLVIFKTFIYRPHILPANAFFIRLFALMLYFGFNVAFPTETVYGLGANIFSLKAIAGIYKKKGRPTTNPLIVHVSSYDDVFHHDLVRMTPNERVFFKIFTQDFWPGPITFVVRANKDKVLSQVRNGTDFVGLRVPNHIVARKLIKWAGVPIAAPSSNRSGNVSPTTKEHVHNDYKNLDICMPILGSSQNSKIGLESTIVKIAEGDDGKVQITILRAGAIGLEQLQESIISMRITIPYTISVRSNNVNSSSSDAPGQEIKHYSPQNAVTYVASTTATTSTIAATNIDKSNAVLIAIDKIVAMHGKKYSLCFTLPSTSQECASQLYSTMRDADDWCEKNKVDTIIICIDGLIVGAGDYLNAIQDKLYRASIGKPEVQL